MFVDTCKNKYLDLKIANNTRIICYKNSRNWLLGVIHMVIVGLRLRNILCESILEWISSYIHLVFILESTSNSLTSGQIGALWPVPYNILDQIHGWHKFGVLPPSLILLLFVPIQKSSPKNSHTIFLCMRTKCGL